MNTMFETEEQIDLNQSEALKEQLSYLAKHSPYYRRVFAQASVDIASIQSVADLPKLPFTTKEELNQFYPEMLCISEDEIADTVVTSGTLGEPIPFHLSEN